MVEIIRICHECEGRIGKSVARDHRLSSISSLMMTNGDPKRRIFLSLPQTNNGLFFLLTTVLIYFFTFI